MDKIFVYIIYVGLGGHKPWMKFANILNEKGRCWRRNLKLKRLLYIEGLKNIVWYVASKKRFPATGLLWLLIPRLKSVYDDRSKTYTEELYMSIYRLFIMSFMRIWAKILSSWNDRSWEKSVHTPINTSVCRHEKIEKLTMFFTLTRTLHLSISIAVLPQ